MALVRQGHEIPVSGPEAGRRRTCPCQQGQDRVGEQVRQNRRCSDHRSRAARSGVEGAGPRVRAAALFRGQVAIRGFVSTTPGEADDSGGSRETGSRCGTTDKTGTSSYGRLPGNGLKQKFGNWPNWGMGFPAETFCAVTEACATCANGLPNAVR